MSLALYFTRNRFLEPLGQSQVLGYSRGLSQDYRIILIAFEKDEGRADAVWMAAMVAECAQLGNRRRPDRFRRNPCGIAPALRMVRMVRMLRLVWHEVRAGRLALIHPRSNIPAAVAPMALRTTAVQFICDTRGLFRRRTFAHRAITAAERACLRHTSAVVSLSHAAMEHLKRQHLYDLLRRSVILPPGSKLCLATTSLESVPCWTLRWPRAIACGLGRALPKRCAMPYAITPR